MNIYKNLFVLSVIVAAMLFTSRSSGLMLPQGNEDSLIKSADNYIQSVNSIGAHGNRFMKIYVRIVGHKQFRLMTYSGYWPDSIEQTVNVTSYEGKPAEYAETPLSVPGSTNIEYDNYYFKGKLIAYRFFELLNSSPCAGSSLTHIMTVYYDSTGKQIKTIHTLFDANNSAVDPATCPSISVDTSHIYKSYSETPLAKEGVEKQEK